MAVPLLGMLVAMPVGVAAGLASTGWLMKNSENLYTQWLKSDRALDTAHH